MERTKGHGKMETPGARLIIILFFLCLNACSNSTGTDTTNAPPAEASVIASLEPVSEASFTATMTGDREMKLEGNDVVAGVKFRRYHINMVSKDPNNVQPRVVIAFGRTDTIAPTPGIYPLAGKGGFTGSIEIYGVPQQDFQITSGELIITEAIGNVLKGSFTFNARETPEEYGDPSAAIEAEGSFISRNAGK